MSINSAEEALRRGLVKPQVLINQDLERIENTAKISSKCSAYLTIREIEDEAQINELVASTDESELEELFKTIQ